MEESDDNERIEEDAEKVEEALENIHKAVAQLDDAQEIWQSTSETTYPDQAYALNIVKDDLDAVVESLEERHSGQGAGFTTEIEAILERSQELS